jgi:hypothetical protein
VKASNETPPLVDPPASKKKRKKRKYDPITIRTPEKPDYSDARHPHNVQRAANAEYASREQRDYILNNYEKEGSRSKKRKALKIKSVGEAPPISIRPLSTQEKILKVNTAKKAKEASTKEDRIDNKRRKATAEALRTLRKHRSQEQGMTAVEKDARVKHSKWVANNPIETTPRKPISFDPATVKAVAQSKKASEAKKASEKRQKKTAAIAHIKRTVTTPSHTPEGRKLTEKERKAMQKRGVSSRIHDLHLKNLPPAKGKGVSNATFMGGDYKEDPVDTARKESQKRKSDKHYETKVRQPRIARSEKEGEEVRELDRVRTKKSDSEAQKEWEKTKGKEEVEKKREKEIGPFKSEAERHLQRNLKGVKAWQKKRNAKALKSPRTNLRKTINLFRKAKKIGSAHDFRAAHFAKGEYVKSFEDYTGTPEDLRGKSKKKPKRKQTSLDKAIQNSNGEDDTPSLSFQDQLKASISAANKEKDEGN